MPIVVVKKSTLVILTPFPKTPSQFSNWASQTPWSKKKAINEPMITPCLFYAFPFMNCITFTTTITYLKPAIKLQKNGLKYTKKCPWWSLLMNMHLTLLLLTACLYFWWLEVWFDWFATKNYPCLNQQHSSSPCLPSHDSSCNAFNQTNTPLKYNTPLSFGQRVFPLLPWQWYSLWVSCWATLASYGFWCSKDS